MVREEIVEGLRFAMNKGESLMKAMMSFYNAGYSKVEVEEAAKMLSQPSLQSSLSPGQTPQAQTPQSPPSQVQPVQKAPKQYVSQPVSQYGLRQPTTQISPQTPPNGLGVPAPGNPQMVSDYSGKNKHPLSTGVMISLSIILFLLLSALVSLILFKDVIAKFFGGFL